MSVATQPTAAGPRQAVEAPTVVAPAQPARADGLYRLSLDQYRRMAEADILGADDRVELIEGLLVEKMTKKPPHIVATALVLEALQAAKPAGWFVLMQDPIALAESASEPEPDAMLVRGAPRDYASRAVGPGDAALVVEVADTSVRIDQVVKKAVYAGSSVATYWIVNLPARRLEVYTDPTGPDSAPDYRRRVDHGPGDAVPLTLDGREVARIAVDDLLP